MGLLAERPPVLFQCGRVQHELAKRGAPTAQAADDVLHRFVQHAGHQECARLHYETLIHVVRRAPDDRPTAICQHLHGDVVVVPRPQVAR
jgi:hypothetical protein